MKGDAAFLGPLGLIAIGVLFLLNNLRIGFDLGDLIRDWWPLLLIGCGLWQVARGLVLGRSVVGGMILSLVGTAFQVHRLWPEISVGELFRTYWPLILVAVGISQLLVVAPGRSRGRAL
jgi:lia operon protein LiaF